MIKNILKIFAAAVLCSSILSGCGNYDDDRQGILKVYNWADYIDEDLISEFEEWYFEETGEEVEVVYQLFDVNEIMLAKIERGKEDFDVVCPSDYIIERMLSKDLLLPINKDFGDTPNYLDNVSPYIHTLFKKMEAHGNDANDYSVGYMWGTNGFLYNTKYVTKEEVDTWSALWNPKFDKKLLIKDAFRDVYTPLLIYANLDKLKSGEILLDSLMYDCSDESIAVVEGLLMQAKPYVAGWEADFGKEFMTKEAAWLNLSWSGDAAWAMEEAAAVGVELDYHIPSEGSIVWFDGWVIPKYAKNTKAASYFINFMCKPENAIRNMEEIGYVSVISTPEILEWAQESALDYGYTDSLDVSYFFGEDGANIVANPIMYPCSSTIEICGMMHDSGSRTEVLMSMWSRVKGNQFNSWMLIVIFVAFGGLFVAGVIKRIRHAQRQNRFRRR